MSSPDKVFCLFRKLYIDVAASGNIFGDRQNFCDAPVISEINNLIKHAVFIHFNTFKYRKLLSGTERKNGFLAYKTEVICYQ